jgi:hypothetical protein
MKETLFGLLLLKLREMVAEYASAWIAGPNECFSAFCFVFTCE